MTAREFSAAMTALVGLEIDHETFAAAWVDIFWPNEPIAPVLSALKHQGYTLVLGSNTNDLHAAQFRAQFATTLAMFDRLILSYEIGHIKPSREFYHACAEAAGAHPGDCVFIDDLAENVEGARAAGLRGVIYRDVPGLVAALRDHGVDPGPRDGPDGSTHPAP